MWNNKDLKIKAKGMLKKHYWRMILICFVAAFVAGAYSSTGTTKLIKSYNPEKAESSEAVQTNIEDAQKSNAQIIEETVKGGKDESETGYEQLKENRKYTRGVFASVFNNITDAGSVVFGFLNSLNQGIFQGKVVEGAILLLGSLLYALFWFFVQNVYKVCQSRYFLESASYNTVSVHRLLFVIHVKKWGNTAKIMFFKWLHLSLWSLTIIGGLIKSYSYRMIPYIVAENPSISKKEAFQLSMAMMKGQKWKTFVLDLSFAGWYILSACSFGLLSIFFLNPYMTAAETQLYRVLREKARTENFPYSYCLDDEYIGLNPLIPAGMDVLPESYPVQCFTLPELAGRKWITVDYRRNYSVWSLILLFFTFSLIGWLWEVSLHLSTDGFVNRGVLQGPWLPIYGSGGVLILVLLKKVREHPLLTFILTVVICGVLEYGTSWFLEATQGKKWWDYSGYLLNLNGRICAEGLLVFGLGGCAFIYFAAPFFDQLYKKISVRRQIIICVALICIFGADFLYSQKHPNQGKGITDYQAENLYFMKEKHQFIRNS